MQRFLLIFANRPWIWLSLLLVCSVLAATQLGGLQIRIAADEMLVADDPLRAYHDEIRSAFGEEQVVIVVAQDEQVASPGHLAALQNTVAELQRLPFVARAESLFNVPHVRGIEGFLEQSPYLAEIPTSPEGIQPILDQAADNPLISGLLISRDTRALAVALVLDDTGGHEDQRIVDAVDAAIAPLRGTFASVYAIGFPQVRNELAARITAEQYELMPLAIGALLLALFLLLRQLIDILTPLVTAGISILWTYGLMGWLEIPVNVVTSTVPILLIVVGSTEDIHLLAEFRHAQRRGDPTEIALRHMARKLGRTVLLTFATTYAGFLSVGLSGIEVLSQFGLIASTGLLFNFLVTIIFIPAALSLTGRWQLDGHTRLFDRHLRDLASSYWRILQARRPQAFVLLGIVTVIAAAGVPRIDISHNPIDSLGDTSPVARDLNQLNERFAGLESFSIIIESGIQDTFLHARYLDELIKVQTFVRSIDDRLSVTSFADYLVLLNEAPLEDPNAGPPESNDEIAELMLFLERGRVSAYVTEDFSRARILVRHQITSNAELRATLKRIQAYLASQVDPGLDTRITGDSVLSLSATDSMITGQLQSVVLILGLFILIVTFIFTDLRVGLLAALPNAFPVIVLFGFMGYSGIPLNIGTTMAAAIAIGIAVDDTLHFLLRYNQELRSSRSQQIAMRNTLYEEALPVISTSLAMIVGFIVFTTSAFVPIAQFGLLSALVIATALIADFIITPLTIASLRLVTLWDLLSSRMRQQVIPNSPLFRDMRPWQIRKFVLSSTLLDFKAGQRVYRQGDRSDAMYLVMQGVVEITVPRPGSESSPPVVDRFTAGQVFGDVALLANESRKTDATALSHTTLMVLTREAIGNVTRLHPFIASRLFYNLARDVSLRWVNFMTRVRHPDKPEDRRRPPQ
jgi:predicted RND superfamily exporter protein